MLEVHTKKIPPVQGDDKGKEIIEYKETKKNENNYISTIKGESVVDFVFFFYFARSH